MSLLERLANALLGLSVLSWGVLGLWHAGPDHRWTIARVGIALLNFTAGGLILFRAPVVRDGGLWGVLAATPSMLAGAWAVRWMPPPGDWPWEANALFLAGVVFTLWAFVSLGASFNIFPSQGAVVSSGPYAWLRHPAYAGELVLIVACFAAHPRWEAVAPLALALPAIVWRIDAEERLLLNDPAYAEYCLNVPSRLLPGVW